VRQPCLSDSIPHERKPHEQQRQGQTPLVFAQDVVSVPAAHLEHVEGSVAYAPPGEQEWHDVQPRRLLKRGDRLWTDRGSRAEVQAGAHALRLDSQTQLILENVSETATQLSVTQGSVIATVTRMNPGDSFEIGTPNLAFRARQAGDYRIDVDPKGITRVAVSSGSGVVYGEKGEAIEIRSGQRFAFRERNLSRLLQPAFATVDDFDRWAGARKRGEPTVRMPAMAAAAPSAPAEPDLGRTRTIVIAGSAASLKQGAPTAAAPKAAVAPPVRPAAQMPRAVTPPLAQQVATTPQARAGVPLAAAPLKVTQLLPQPAAVAPPPAAQPAPKPRAVQAAPAPQATISAQRALRAQTAPAPQAQAAARPRLDRRVAATEARRSESRRRAIATRHAEEERRHVQAKLGLEHKRLLARKAQEERRDKLARRAAEERRLAAARKAEDQRLAETHRQQLARLQEQARREEQTVQARRIEATRRADDDRRGEQAQREEQARREEQVRRDQQRRDEETWLRQQQPQQPQLLQPARPQPMGVPARRIS
jgi:hypothetical protein